MTEWKRYHIGYWADTFEEAKAIEKVLDERLSDIDGQWSGIIGGHMADGKFTEDFDFDLSTRPVEPSAAESTHG